MRLVPIDNACNAFLAEDIYDLQGKILLKKETKISTAYANRMKNSGYASVYVKDAYSIIDLKPFLSSELRNSILNSIRELHQHIRHPKSKNFISYKSIDTLIELGQDVEYELNARRQSTIDYLDIKSNQTYTYEHCISVAILSFLLSKSLGYNPQELSQIFIGALFHDIGMAYIDESVFMKNGKLNVEEFIKIKEHPTKGYEFIKELSQFSAYAKVILLQHHEKLDGTGYPNKLLGNAIHPYAKIVSVCDIYDAMTSNRPYSKAVEPYKALNYLDEASNTQLDSVTALRFMKIIMPFPPGTIVKLSTKTLAVVTANEEAWPTRPQVQIIDPVKKALTSRCIKLMNEPNISIEHVVHTLL